LVDVVFQREAADTARTTQLLTGKLKKKSRKGNFVEGKRNFSERPFFRLEKKFEKVLLNCFIFGVQKTQNLSNPNKLALYCRA
jgi:hypothetical protein